jgi:hypothetical protein
MDLILSFAAPQHRQLDFISSLPFWMKPEVIFLPVFHRTTDVQQFVKDFCFHQSQRGEYRPIT